MKDMLIRFLFVLWCISGALLMGFGFAGLDHLALIFSFIFVVPIVLIILWMAVTWIITGR